MQSRCSSHEGKRDDACMRLRPSTAARVPDLDCIITPTAAASEAHIEGKDISCSSLGVSISSEACLSTEDDAAKARGRAATKGIAKWMSEFDSRFSDSCMQPREDAKEAGIRFPCVAAAAAAIVCWGSRAALDAKRVKMHSHSSADSRSSISHIRFARTCVHGCTRECIRSRISSCLSLTGSYREGSLSRRRLHLTLQRKWFS